MADTSGIHQTHERRDAAASGSEMQTQRGKPASGRKRPMEQYRGRTEGKPIGREEPGGFEDQDIPDYVMRDFGSFEGGR